MNKLGDQQMPLAWASERLTFEHLRQVHADEVDEVEHALCEPAVYKFIDGSCPDLSDLRSAFQRMEAGAPAERSAEKWLNFLVRVRHNGEAIGRVEATVIEDYAEIAYLLGPAYWGRGFGTEAVMWLHQHLSDGFGVAKFWATVQPGNVRSIGLLCRAGYTQAPRRSWPRLTSYDPGDLVYFRSASPNHRMR
jgi:RimJ/RimL family protein N-acetyltransferase